MYGLSPGEVRAPDHRFYRPEVEARKVNSYLEPIGMAEFRLTRSATSPFVSIEQLDWNGYNVLRNAARSLFSCALRPMLKRVL